MKVVLTQAAISHIQKLLARKPTPQVFRLTVKRAGCNGYLYQPLLADHAEPDDICLVEVTEFPAYIAACDVALLEGVTVDCVELGLGQRKLVFQNPKAVAECGCGESFSVTPADQSDEAETSDETGCR